MGKGLSFHCEQCGYSFDVSFGVGRRFPQTYQETIQAVKNGELGDELKTFLTEHPDGALDASFVAGVCTKCGAVHNVQDLSMYLPKKNSGRWPVAAPFDDAEYVSPWELTSDYELFAEYPHKCERCGSDMKIFTQKTFRAPEHCPNCHGQLIGGLFMWD